MAQDHEDKGHVTAPTSDQPEDTSRPVWQDEDDEGVATSGNAADASEPEWVRKRRRQLLEARDRAVAGDDFVDPGALTGKLTKVKAGSRSSGVRFRIDRDNDPRHNVAVTGGVSQLGFDHTGSLLAVLGRREKSLRLFEVDRHRSEGKHFRLKGEITSPASPGHTVSSFAFASNGKGILMVADHKAVLKYDPESSSTVRIASITNLRTEYGYRRVHTPPAPDDRGAADVFALSCSDHGGVLLCDSRSNSIMHHFQMNATAVGVGFHLRAGIVVTADEDANVYEWDLATGRCSHKFKDDHSLRLTSFAMSPSIRAEFARHAFMVAGSQMGFLNLFPVVPDAVGGPPPSSYIAQDHVKTYGNLSTAVTSIAAEDNGTFIAYASEHKRNALRIVHNPSGCVVGNWPTEKVNLGRVTDVAFASRFSTLAVGNRTGRVQFFRILTK
ncbi:WD-40 repeat protein [Babesia caballi]|uniref:WD-40 repeat protein n=1 Tax=Babesia caballi TaxID=5871 RepID=A0AAV4LW40_BABCB|nr:WD-40 repeat protein [Babesia caballi]